MKCVMGIVPPIAGRIKPRSTASRTTSSGADRRDRRSRHCAGADAAACSRLTVEENLLGAFRKKARAEIEPTAFCFECFAAGRAARSCQLDERRRAADAARARLDAVAAHPLIDEPSVGLALVLVARTIEKIKELKERYKLTVLMAEQNFPQALRIADRGYVTCRQIAFEAARPRAQQQRFDQEVLSGAVTRTQTVGLDCDRRPSSWSD
jgi:branched-chain amino acid transport system ATP-binding protein